MKKIMIYIFLFLSLVTLSSCSFDDTYIINQDVQTIAIGEKTVLKLSNDIGDITWKSSDEAIATVDEFGVVTGISGGIVTITATVENNTYSIMVSVDAKKSDPIPEGLLVPARGQAGGDAPMIYLDNGATSLHKPPAVAAAAAA